MMHDNGHEIKEEFHVASASLPMVSSDREVIFI
jgi:hypothetical protein